jgi:hypothetical protein|tara:strand:- start:11281 stop:11481 length:201 start_codon:yes stop_codon:yes gene_type:complete
MFQSTSTPKGQTMEIPQEDYKRIEEVIYSAESPVGIDAKKTHVMILHMLEQIDERLRRLESAPTSP